MPILAGLLLTSLLRAAPAGAAVSSVDDLGREITLASPAGRIVSLAPHATELLFAAGAGDRVVGAVTYSDYPPAAKRVPRVGAYTSPDLERVVALQPDLVVVWWSGNGPPLVERLERLGLKVYVSEPRRLEAIPTAVEQLGRLAGTGAQAQRAAADFRRRLTALTHRYLASERLSVFYEVWNRPLMTVGGDHLISDVIRRCGGRNLFEQLDELAPTVGIESVIAANPQVIIASGMGEARPEWLDEWRRWPAIDAVAHGQLHFVPPDLLQRPTPRLLAGAERLCAALESARRAYGSAVE